MANAGTKYVDLQDEKHEITATEYLSEDLKKNWARVWDNRTFNVEGRFHEGKAYTAAKKHLWYTGWVTLCGYPGDGKTCTAEHLVCNFVRGRWFYPSKGESTFCGDPTLAARHKNKYYTRSIAEDERARYTPVYINSPAEYKSQLDPKENQIFVIDDIFGKAGFNTSLMEQWRPHLKDMMVELMANRPKTLVIICVNKAHLDRLPELTRLDWFKTGMMIDFTSSHPLDNEDKKKLIKKNALRDDSLKSEREMKEMGFFEVKESPGLVYRIYNQIKSFKMEGTEFFRNPWKFVQDSIDKIYRFDKIFYHTIAVATLLDGHLDLSKYSVAEYDPRTQDVIQELIPLLNVPEHVNLSKMRFAAKQLTGFFFEPTDQWKWKFTHPKIYQLCVKSLYGLISKDVIRLASADLILNYIRTTKCLEEQYELTVKVARESYEELARKFIHEIISGKVRECVQNPCFGDDDFVKVWFEHMATLDITEDVLEQRDPDLKRSLFYWACYYGQGYVVQGVLKSSSNKLNNDWFIQEMKQGLFAACGSNSPTSKVIVQCLLERDTIGASVCEVYEEATHGTAFGEEKCYLMYLEAPTIHVAARFGHPEVVKLLLAKGEKHSVKTKDGLTPLHRAVSRHDSDGEAVIDILIKQGAKIDATTPNGRKPIHEAVACGNKTAVAALVNAGENIHGSMEDGHSFLSIAVQGLQKDLVDYLVMKDVRVDGNPEDNFTPLQHAIRNGDANLVELLVNNKGADVNKMGKARFSAVHVAVMYQEEGILQKLIEKGAMVNVQGAGNVTPLHMAARHGLYAMCDKLLDAKAKPEMMTTNRETALVLAAREGHKSVVWLLLKEGMELEGPVAFRGFGPFMGREFIRMFHH